jgi:hypothetical protein
MVCLDAAPRCTYTAARLLAFLLRRGVFFYGVVGAGRAAIWALSTDFTMGHTSNLLDENTIMLDLEEESRAVLQLHFSDDETSTCVMLVEPLRMNARLAVQQGCFIVPGNLSKSFMENLAYCLEVDPTTALCSTRMSNNSSIYQSSRLYCRKRSTTKLSGILIK